MNGFVIFSNPSDQQNFLDEMSRTSATSKLAPSTLSVVYRNLELGEFEQLQACASVWGAKIQAARQYSWDV